MPVNVLQWRAGIGNFYKCTQPLFKIKSSLLLKLDIRKILTIFFYSIFSRMLIMQHGDIESNPGPSKKHRPLTCCHWNVNSLTSHKMIKKSLIEAYNSNHKYDFICISETYLDSSLSDDDKELAMKGYNFICADHPSNVKKGGVGIYYKESIAVQIININFLSECLLCEVTVNNKKGYIAVLYRSPSQTNTVFNDFLSNFEKLLQELSALNPDFSIILGDFNARSKSWWKSDINTIEGTKIDSVTTSYGLQQLITQPTHLLANSSYCIDLIFTDQPSLITDCGIHPSLNPNYHHQVVSCKF